MLALPVWSFFTSHCRFVSWLLLWILRYEGGWSEDVMHGECVIRKASGGRFEGSFRHGKKTGQGKESWGNMVEVPYQCPMGHRHEGRGFCIYEGGFCDGYFHGEGSFVCVDGRRS